MRYFVMIMLSLVLCGISFAEKMSLSDRIVDIWVQNHELLKDGNNDPVGVMEFVETKSPASFAGTCGGDFAALKRASSQTVEYLKKLGAKILVSSEDETGNSKVILLVKGNQSDSVVSLGLVKISDASSWFVSVVELPKETERGNSNTQPKQR